MPNIIDKTYFQKANELNIPLGADTLIANPAIATPNQAEALTQLITKIEKSILLNALGLATYNTLQLALADIDNPLYASYKKLVQGESYDGKVWNGLNNDYSLIAYRVYEEFVTETNQILTGVGNTQGNPEKATLRSPRYKIANANSNFISQYQGGYLTDPIIDGIFIDWLGSQEGINVSLYQYLVDKATDFPNVDMTKFKIYETQNSFGI